MDAHHERLLHQAMQTIRRDRTVLVIAHRLSTVRTADRVVVAPTPVIMHVRDAVSACRRRVA